jgi:ATP-dependent exoDNAse (exonuclease V) beta subunit
MTTGKSQRRPATLRRPLTHTVIRASAGTGKTWQLSNRYLQLLSLGAAPQSILATTFTRKAAGEILQRVLVRLARGGLDEPGAAELAQALHADLTLPQCQAMLADLCRGLHRVAISTIDGFFNRIVQSFRHELGIPPQATIVAEDDARAVELRQQAIDELVADRDPELMLDLLHRLHHDGAKRSITQAIDAIVSRLYHLYREAPSAAVWSTLTPPPPPGECHDELAVKNEATFAKDKRLRTALEKLADCVAHNDWKAVLETGLVAKAMAGQTTYYNKDLPEPVVELLKLLARRALHEQIAAEARRVTAMHELVADFHQRYERLRHDRRVLLFSDLPYRLLEYGGSEPADDLRDQIAYRLDRRVGHLLLDEFQDTSVQQWHVLRPFAQEITSHGDGSRTFFCVGDLKQSIYGWRGGCADIFDRVESDLNLEDEARLSLSESRRSAQPVLDAVNTVFRSMAQSPALKQHVELAQQWQDRFEDHSTHRREARGYVELMTSDSDIDTEESESNGNDGGRPPRTGGDDDSAAGFDPHLCFAADQVESLLRRGPGRSIGVLTRRNHVVAQMIAILQRRGIAASGEGGNPLTDDPAVMLVLSALWLADHPADTISAFHVWHSPLAAALGLSSLATQHLAEVSAGIRRQLLREGYAATIGAWAVALAPSCEPRNAARLTQLIALADGHDDQATLRPGDFCRLVESTMIEEPAAAAVRVMTVHKAKGLEFDAVILCDLEGPMAQVRDALALAVRDEPTAPVRAVLPPGTRELREMCPPLQEAYCQAQQSRLRDALCSLYVAMTRARSALYLILRPLKQTKTGIGARGYTDESAATLVRNALSTCSDEQPGIAQTLHAQGDPDWFDDGKPQPEAAAPIKLETLDLHLDASPAQTRRSWRRISPSSLASPQVTARELLTLQTSRSRRRGTLMHAWLQQVQWLDEGEPDDATLLAQPAARAFDESDMPALLREFRAMLRRPAVRQALVRPACAPGASLDLWRERPILVRLDQQLLQGVIDRAVIHRDSAGKAVGVDLLDFKTDRVRDDDDAQRLADHYRPQLRAYREALQTMLHLPREAVQVSLLMVEAGLRV